MKIFPGIDHSDIQHPTVLTLGVFDGLHLGHQAIVRTVVDRAASIGATPTLITFDPHPRQVLKPDTAPPLLQTFNQKMEGLKLLGIEQVVVLDFVAVWCAHSRDHIPTVNRFDDEDRERGLKIIGLIINDRETSQSRVQQFIKDQKVEYPVTLISQDLFERFIDSKDTDVPQTLVYGRNGRLAAHFIGHDATIDAQLTTAIKQELDKKN